MARARIASSAKTSLKFFIYGKHGTWKSSTAIGFAKMKREDGKPLRVLYIDCETGSLEGFIHDKLEEEGIDTGNIYIIYTSSLSEVKEYCQKFIDNETYNVLDDEGFETDEIVLDADGQPFIADAIVIDGISVIADNVSDAAINLSEKRAAIKARTRNATQDELEVAVGTAGLEFKDHNKIKLVGKNLVRNLITGTDKYVAITARAKDKKEMIKDSNGNMVLTNMGYEVPESWDFIQYEVFTVLHNFLDDDGNVYSVVENKDRTGQFKQGEIINEPCLSLWQPIIDKNKNKKSNVGMRQVSTEQSILENEEEFSKIIQGKAEQGSKSSSKDTSSQEGTAEFYISKIDEIKNNLPVSKRRAVKPLLEKEGLPLTYANLSDIDTLKRIYEIISGL